MVEALWVQWCRLKEDADTMANPHYGLVDISVCTPITPSQCVSLGVAVIRGVTMDLKPGTVTAIVGPSGCVLIK